MEYWLFAFYSSPNFKSKSLVALDIAKGHQELAQSVIVQRIRVGRRWPSDNHDSAVAPHGGVTRGRLANTCWWQTPGDEQCVDTVLAQQAIEFRWIRK